MSSYQQKVLNFPLKSARLTNSSSYPFCRMFTPSALKKAGPFLDHEFYTLKNVIEQSPNLKNIVVVGSGPLAYSEFASDQVSYFGVDPYFHAECNELAINVSSINCFFEDLSRDQLPEGNTIFVFWFNVFFYLSDPYKILNPMLREGDIVFHSTWSSDQKARLSMNRYFKEIYRGTSKNYRTAVKEISGFPKKIGDSIQLAKHVETFSNGINSVEVIYTKYQN